MVLPAVTLFLASALLFLVEPMTARQVLPMLGGTSAVWTTCMLFFQVMLLGGYAYAHRAPARLGARLPGVHLAVLLLPFVPLLLPIPPFWNGIAGAAPVAGLLLMLAATIGLPFFVLATTAPLVQRQLAASGRAGAAGPWWLYATSNAGSFVGLLAYPTLVEPLLSLGEQRTLWTVGYALVALGTAWCVWTNRGAAPAAPAVSAASAPVPAGRRLLWVLLAFAPSSLLLGVTSHLSTNLAPVPLLWVVPLALYLATCVIAFARPSRANRPPKRSMLPKWLPPFLRWNESAHPVTAVLPVLLLPLAVLIWWERAEHLPVLVLLHLGTFFLAALACHGRLADLRPEPAQLTGYYLWIAFGGALGGVLNGLVAPFVFPTPLEYPLLLALVCFLLPGGRQTRSDLLWGLAIAGLAAAALVVPDRGVVALAPAAVLALLVAERPLRLGLGVTGILVAGGLLDARSDVVHRDRSVYGAHRVDRIAPHVLCLVHGNILHGAQVQEDGQRGEPLTYYHRQGPCGEIFAALAGRIPNGRVGAVGLGAGTIAAYGAPGERWTFFELDAAVARTARAHFTYLADSKAAIDVQIGDGRLLLAGAPDGEFGLILLDAFNSDAVPVHLLTREALAIYLQKLAPGGVIALNVSSSYVDLPPLLGDLAADAGLAARWRNETGLPDEETTRLKRESTWVVLARRAEDLAKLPGPAWAELPPRAVRTVWTDDRSSLLGALKFLR